jgi:single-strand DNA-binding protein
MQILTIAGTVGKDATLRRTQSGDAVLGFSLAVDNGKDANGTKRDATWYDCSIWGKRAESLERHITKGLRLTLTGSPTARAHEGKAYLGIRVNDLTFQGGNSPRDDARDEPTPSAGGYDRAAQEQYARQQTAGMDDEIPFD